MARICRGPARSRCIHYRRPLRPPRADYAKGPRLQFKSPFIRELRKRVGKLRRTGKRGDTFAGSTEQRMR